MSREAWSRRLTRKRTEGLSSESVKELHVQFCLHLEFEIFMEGSHFRLAHKHTEFPVEASHPPTLLCCFPRRAASGTGRALRSSEGAKKCWLLRLFSFQSTLYPSFLFARTDTMTFVQSFLTARDSYQKLQFSAVIIHL